MAYRETTKTITKKAEVRDNILLSARNLVLQGGFRLATVSAVAAEAKIATGTVYRYFPSKSELFSEVFRAATELEVNKVAEAIDIDAPFTQRLIAAVNCFSKRALKAPRLAWALIAEPVDPVVDADRLHYRQAYAEIFERLIEEGVKSGEVPPQNKCITAAALVGAMAESLVGPLSPSSHTATSSIDRDALINSIAQFCVQAVTGQETRL
ncbi:TetR/AcrR family transcriptional regulator [Alkalimarinus sediminis]|uniref:TetR/AcrR family transcriptional regulator n=1 Tax=Alkalimarinus sediminis TaxID=1632866 RepID=A0A9E8KII3_9ALTE|nr:TetR/AcrR family transcriptional regulator [Alkalimarinus sediminis]UZW73956.1 TetR/AcrR family transcriptional regulator [Alkalimarinus sediminis]